MTEYARLTTLQPPYAASWQSQLLRQAKVNGRKKGVEMTLTTAHLDQIAERAGGHCELSGLPFSWHVEGGGRRRPWAPSLDRISRHGPYSAENVRLVCCIVNIAMGEWGAATLVRMARAVAKNIPNGNI
jgi:hypothetical protein